MRDKDILTSYIINRYIINLLINSDVENWLLEHTNKRYHEIKNEVLEFWTQNKLKYAVYQLTAAGNILVDFSPFLDTYLLSTTGQRIKSYAPEEFNKVFYKELLDIFNLIEEYKLICSNVVRARRQFLSSPIITKEMEIIITKFWNHETITYLENTYKGMEILNE